MSWIPTLGDIVYYKATRIVIVMVKLIVNNRSSLSLFNHLPSLCRIEQVQILVFDCAPLNDGLEEAIKVVEKTSHLTTNECQQLSQRKKSRQKLHFLISRALIKHYVSSALSLPIDTLSVVFNSQLKVLQVFKGYTCLPLSLSLSHSKELIAIALDFNAANKMLGIDVEWLDLRRPVGDMAQLAFTASEQANIADSTDPFQTFYQYWTQKEALIKATQGSIFSNFERDVSTEIGQRELTHQTVKLAQYILTVVSPPDVLCHLYPVVPITHKLLQV